MIQDGGYTGQTRKACVSGPVQSFQELAFTDLKKKIGNFTEPHENDRWKENLTLVRVIKCTEMQG